MIYVDVKGNLGNQMFEYACARKIQKITGQTICLNICSLLKYKPEYKFALSEFYLNDNVIVESKKRLPWYMNVYKMPMKFLKKFFPRIVFNFLSKKGIFLWIRPEYIELPLNKNIKDYYLCGYWQSTKYFSDIRDILIKEFTPKKELLIKNKDLYNKIIDSESVCVTIRRGDYIDNPKYRKKFFICDDNYFLKGVKKIREDIPHAKIFVFSDDIEWVKNNIDFGKDVYFEIGDDTVYEKLRLMSNCKHFIISNSTFSWWSQYLCTNDEKIVYAPSRWYPDNRACDIQENFWKYIEV